jgi:hypothetical protein
MDMDFSYSVYNVLHVWKKLEKNILIDGVHFKILRPNILVVLGMFMGFMGYIHHEKLKLSLFRT